MKDGIDGLTVSEGAVGGEWGEVIPGSDGGVPLEIMYRLKDSLMT